ncbi:glycosyltransferase family 2 protein [Sediminicola luteus]|uniref:Glycosyltransferase family 2 protein n=1 Tax=Sediminicola luteus TaxID=319238 RepID=A0ABV2TU44_9FLAO
MTPKVSIVTPTYNSEKYIEETIKSVLNQSYTNWEIIIIDDKSSDNTSEIVKAYQLKDTRIYFFQLQENSGSAIARNTGIERATGDFLTFLDADDIWMPNFIEVSINVSTKKKCPFVFSSYKRFDENLNPLLKDFIVPDKVTYTDILKSNPISCLTAFINIKQLGKKYMPNLRKRQDFGLWLQYLKDIDFALGIKEPLAIYRIRKSSLSRNKRSLIKYQWLFYYKIEKLNFFYSVYYLVNWMVRGYFKYRS